MIAVETLRKGKRVFGPNIALNDCVIRCGEQARAISLRTHWTTASWPITSATA